jgi:pimeloyl-ACP methyl ester carboxylesterase
MKIKHHRIRGSVGKYLHVHTRSSDNSDKKPVIIFVHGFITDGVENHRLFMDIAKKFNQYGYSTVLYDNYGCGYSDGDYMDFRLSIAASDLSIIAKWSIKSTSCNNSVVFFGQSLGTAVISIALKNIKCNIFSLIFMNFSGNIKERYPILFGADVLNEKMFCVKHKGYYVSSDFYSEASNYDTVKALSILKSPILFITCGGDNMVDKDLVLCALNLLNVEKKHLIVSDATHSFNCQKHLENYAVDESIKWLESIYR